MEKIIVKSKAKQYMVVDEQDNELGVIKVDVTDFNFFNRVKEAEKQITEIMKKVEQLHVVQMPIEEAFVQLEVLDKEAKEQLNRMFDYDVSSVVFGNKNCLSIGGGEMFLARFMEAVLPAIKHDIEKEQRESQKKIAKYTKGYTK